MARTHDTVSCARIRSFHRALLPPVPTTSSLHLTQHDATLPSQAIFIPSPSPLRDSARSFCAWNALKDKRTTPVQNIYPFHVCCMKRQNSVSICLTETHQMPFPPMLNDFLSSLGFPDFTTQHRARLNRSSARDAIPQSLCCHCCICFHPVDEECLYPIKSVSDDKIAELHCSNLRP